MWVFRDEVSQRTCGDCDTYATEPGTSSVKSWHLEVFLFAFSGVGVSHEDDSCVCTLLRSLLFYLRLFQNVSMIFEKSQKMLFFGAPGGI